MERVTEDENKAQTAGEYIGILRRKKGVTMREAAEGVGLRSAGHWSDIEHDKKPADGMLHKIADYLGGSQQRLRELVSSAKPLIQFERSALAPEKWRLVYEMYRRIDDLSDTKVVEIMKKLT